jgi:tetratricopeptide (TPR) repeat protein
MDLNTQLKIISEKSKMLKKLSRFLGILFLAGTLVACSSPEEKAADYIQNANALVEEGKLEKAELEYRNALQINQNQPDAWYGLAKIHERKQDWRKVYGALNRIRELAPSHVDGRIMLAQLLLASNQIDQALTDAQEILELAPGNTHSHSLMAAVQFRLDNYKGAEEEVARALAIDPANGEATLVRARVLIAEKKYKAALAVLDKALDTDPNYVSMYLMKIQVFQERGDQKEIEKVYVTLAERFPENLSFQHALVRQYLAQKNTDDAEAVMQQIIELNPANVEEKLRYVGFVNQIRSVDDAIALLKSYIDADKEEFRYRFLLAELYEKSKQSDQALAIYQEIINDEELQSNGLEARNKIALIEIRAGNVEKAKTLVSEVLTQDKNNENALLLQTGFHLADQQYDDAIVSARTVLRDNPESIKALGLLGQAYMASGSTELAIESYTKAFRQNPGSTVITSALAKVYIRQRKASQADEILQESIAKGNRSADVLRLLAQTKLSLGEWDKAEQIAKQLEKVKGQEAISQQVLGVVYQGKEQQEESIDAFKRAHELSPTASQPIVSLVQTYARDGKIDKARRFLNSVIATNSENAVAYVLLGRLALAEKKTTEAIKQFNKVIEISPKADIGYRSLASIYRSENDINSAEKTLKRGLSAIPDSPVLSMNLASIYEVDGEYDKAIKIYDDLLAKNSDLLVARNNLASLLTDQVGDQASLERARKLAAGLRSSQIPQFRDTYAWASVKSGINVEEAIVILEGIVKDNDQVDVYNYHLGEAYRKKGETDNAVAYLKKAAELASPGSDIADKAKQSLQQIN